MCDKKPWDMHVKILLTHFFLLSEILDIHTHSTLNSHQSDVAAILKWPHMHANQKVKGLRWKFRV